MRVYVDQGMCTGAGVCEALAPDVFGLDGRGLATVKASGDLVPEGGGPDGVEVPAALEEQVLEAEASCPGGCIIVIED